MTAHFKSEHDEIQAFQLRAEMLRPMFGLWDAEDPVSHRLLDVVEAQRELVHGYGFIVGQSAASRRVF
jgi:hypothetical protein